MTTPVLYCHCAHAHTLDEEARGAALDALIGAGVAYEAVDDLCGLAVDDPQRLRDFASGGGVVLACHPRAVVWLFHRAGAELDAARVVDLRDGDVDAVRARLPSPPDSKPVKCSCGIAKARTQTELACDDVDAEAWRPWYPVIDYDRCIHCRQCVNFCIFGVYTVDADRRVQVTSPANCKTNCPACARVCPQVAIVFPQHRDAPINGGEGVAQAPVAVDVQGLVANDPYVVLRARQATGCRFGAQADGGAAPCACQTEVLAQLGVPAEVLADNAEAIRQALDTTRGGGSAEPEPA